MIPMPAQAERSERTKVFISYSRKDNLLADDLRLKLLKLDFEAYLDKHDILPGEPWQERLGSLIKAADSVVFLISPDSVASRTCDWEINETERLGKRLLPVVIREVDEGSVPGRLKRLNYIFMRETDNTPAAFDALQAALRTDIAWIREHTRLAELAHRWETERYPVRLLLRGTDIAIAEAWRDGRPSSAPRPSPLHLDFIQQSRNRATLVARRWAVGTAAVAVLTSAMGLIANEARVAAGLAALDAQLTSEALTISAALGTRDQGSNLARAIHAYSFAERELGAVGAPVWNALRLAYEQTRVVKSRPVDRGIERIVAREDGGVTGLSDRGDVHVYDAGLSNPRIVELAGGAEPDEQTSFGFARSRLAVWKRHGNSYRFWDLLGTEQFDGRSFPAAAPELIDAAGNCVAHWQGHALHLSGFESEDAGEVVRLLEKATAAIGDPIDLGLAADCQSLLLSGARTAVLLRRQSLGRWTLRSLARPDGTWSASPSMSWLATHRSKGTEVAIYDEAKNAWREITLFEEPRAEALQIKSLLLSDAGNIAVDFGQSIAVFDQEGRRLVREVVDIVGGMMDFSADGDRLAYRDRSNGTLSIFSAVRTKLIEPVLAGLPFGGNEKISALANCSAGQLAIGGSSGTVLVFDLAHLEAPAHKLDAKQFVRRFECLDDRIAAVVSDHGVMALDLAGSPWLSEEWTLSSGFAGAAIYPLSGGRWLRAGRDVVSILDATGRETTAVGLEDPKLQVAMRNGSFDRDTRTLFLLGDAVDEEDGRFGARATIFSVEGDTLARIATVTDRHGLYYSVATRVGEQIALMGLAGRLSIFDLRTQTARHLGGAAQLVAFSMERMASDRFVVATLHGEIELWTVGGVHLKPDLSLSMTNTDHSAATLAQDRATGELYFATGTASVFRTVLSGARLRERACAQLAKLAGTPSADSEDCRPQPAPSAWVRRVSPVPEFRTITK